MKKIVFEYKAFDDFSKWSEKDNSSFAPLN